ncbi:MAG: FAD-binding protein [Bacteroidia bacterium]
MQKQIQIQTSPSVAADDAQLKKELINQLSLTNNDLLHFKIVKRSIDARNRNIKINLTINAFINEDIKPTSITINYQNVSDKKCCHIIGAGPAGLFAALRCIELGIKPIIFERGKNVKDRRRDLAAINKEHVVNPESNYCFGEGGAGTYSDGKLYTRSNKRGDIEKVLKTLVFHGASEDILIEAHPHIGTNKLPQVITQIRETILKHGGEIHFESKLIDFEVKQNKISTITIQSQNSKNIYPVSNVILATGHSARDIYYLLNAKNILLEAKPFALGVRVEHPQHVIDAAQYHCNSLIEVSEKRKLLPASSYSLVHQVNGYGVYSFCMCPGGIIAPCATDKEEVVTNGWSPSKRNNPYANSGIVVGLNLNDYKKHEKLGALSGLAFQQEIEKQAWVLGGKTQTAPAQALSDFINNKFSNQLPNCSYQPGIKSTNMFDVLGKNIAFNLQAAFKNFGSKIKNFITNDALIVGVESRTSTPVRIPRDKETLQHLQISNLYPCAEGAGYAGGIMSAAMDGEKCVEAILKNNF